MNKSVVIVMLVILYALTTILIFVKLNQINIEHEEKMDRLLYILEWSDVIENN